MRAPRRSRARGWDFTSAANSSSGMGDGSGLSQRRMREQPSSCRCLCSPHGAKRRVSFVIEEEFQMVDRQTGQLSPHIQTILEKGHAIFGELIKPEILQSTVEINSDILPDIPTARQEMRALRAELARLVREEGLALVSAGTHPTALWQNESRSPYERYSQLDQELQDVARSVLIFGLHVHIGIESHELAVELMNQLRTWLPHLLAISTNSPCWAGRLTGLKSYRSVVWKPFPRSGVPEVF